MTHAPKHYGNLDLLLGMKTRCASPLFKYIVMTEEYVLLVVPPQYGIGGEIRLYPDGTVKRDVLWRDSVVFSHTYDDFVAFIEEFAK